MRRLALALGVLLTALPPSASLAAPAARLHASLPPHARLGEPAAIRLQLVVDRRIPVPVERVRLLYPAGIDLVSSGLALEACERAAVDFQTVMIAGHGLGGCPRNSVVGVGHVRGEVRLHPLTIGETATITLLAGPLRDGGLDLVALVEGLNPFGALLSYAGRLTPARAPYGGTIDVELPRIPELPYSDADLALLRIDATIGSDAIVYVERDGKRIRRYRPGGPSLPSRCRPGGLPFAAKLTFADGRESVATTSVRCPSH